MGICEWAKNCVALGRKAGHELDVLNTMLVKTSNCALTTRGPGVLIV